MIQSKSDAFWIRHLLRRAGFNASPDEMDHYQKLGYEAALDELLHPEQVNNEGLEDKIKAQFFDYTDLADLQRWWLYRMTYGRCPLEEKMTLFWHGHFATSNRKVNNVFAMYVQNMLFRKYGLGNFHELLYSVSTDPAMIVWLDNQQNRKGKPNENYAREIMELFTLGIGNYSEQDIKEAARAFTGWQTQAAKFVFNRNQHDFGQKTFLGQTGDFNGDDIVNILVTQPATSKFLAKKLCKFFVADTPSDAMIARIAGVYSSNQFNIRKVLRAIFSDDEFLSEASYHAKIKSPAEYVVGSLKLLQVKNLDPSMPVMMERMGQSLFKPPNVKGWDGGKAWVSTDKMMERFNFAAKITSQRFNEIEKYFGAQQLMQKQGLHNPKEIVNYFLALLVDDDVPETARRRLVEYAGSDISGKPLDGDPDEKTLDAKLRGLVHLIMTLPSYQIC